MKKLGTLVLLMAALGAASAQTPKTISQLRVNDANGIPNNGDTLTRVSTTGVVYGPNTNKYRTTGGLTFVLNDHQAGVKVYSTRSFGYTFHEGDSILVVGTMQDFKGEAELSTHAGDTIILLGQGTLDAPVVVPDLGSNGEGQESQLIELDNIDMATVAEGTANGDWGIYNTNTYFTAWFNPATLHDNNAIYIDSFCNQAMFLSPKPRGIYNIVGFGAQHIGSTGNLASGYQIVPRSLDDFHFVSQSVGIHDLSSASLDAAVYPNPASTKVNVQFLFDKNETASATITDISGRTVLAQEVGVVNGENVVTFNTASLATGMYTLTMNTSSKSLISKITITK